jgi:hypothetical protein
MFQGATRCVATIASFLLICGLSAKADHISGNAVISISGWDGTTTLTDEILVPVSSDHTFNIQDAPSASDLWMGEIDAWGDSDPFTNLAFSITNLAAVPVEYTFSITIPIVAIPGGTVHGGSTGGSTTDANGDGSGGLSTITSVAGVPFYAGQIDGTTVLSIYPDPTSFAFIFGGQTITIPALNPGLPGPTLPSGPALLTIGIVHRFKLSPGDSAAATSFFQVEVPEPSAIVLAAIGAAGVVWLAIRRRRK